MIIGTAGHIDHGKSALVTALTGRMVDRLAEEQRRGITIDLNFAPLTIEGSPPAGIVDVPGHEDFVRTMVAGSSGVDLVLLVIDLAEGPRPQTFEHLAILEQLRIPSGIPVYTKADLVEPDWAELVVADFAHRLTRSAVQWGPPAIVSAHTGQGIDGLRERLRVWIAAQAGRAKKDDFRMPIDRAFSMAGVGTIVTGTTWSGSVSIGDQVRILPNDVEARVRSIEAYGHAQPSALPGVRTALGVVGIEKADVGRGHTVVVGPWQTTTALDAELELLPTSKSLGLRSRVRVHLGTAEVLARVYPRQPLEPGGAGLTRLALEKPVVARGGDRFVIRSYSPVETIGGGRVVDALAPRRGSWPDGLMASRPADWASALAARRAFGIEQREVAQLLGPSGASRLKEAGLILVGQRWVPQATLLGIGTTMVSRVKAHHQRFPAEPGLSLETLRQAVGAPNELAERVIQDLAAKGTVRLRGGVVAVSGFTQTLVGGEEAMTNLGLALEAAGLEIATADELASKLGVPSAIPLLRKAIELGTAEAVDREHFASRVALDRFTTTLQEIGAGGDITPAAIRERLGLSRKYLIPLLEWADRRGVTRRVGDVRVLVQTGR